jgi:hypothetical protein
MDRLERSYKLPAHLGSAEGTREARFARLASERNEDLRSFAGRYRQNPTEFDTSDRSSTIQKLKPISSSVRDQNHVADATPMLVRVPQRG